MATGGTANSDAQTAGDTPARQLRRQWKAARQAAIKKCSGHAARNPERFVVLFAGGKVLPAARAAQAEHGKGLQPQAAAQQAVKRQAVEHQVAEQQAVEQQAAKQHVVGQQAAEQQADEEQGVEYLDAEEQVDEEPLPEEQVMRCKAWRLISMTAPC